MNNKQPSIIKSIDLSNKNTFNNEAQFSPSLINFLYGKNGTGKTTVSRTISTDTSRLTFSDGFNSSNFNILAFNKDFVDKHFSTYESIPGVFMIGGDAKEAIEAFQTAKDNYDKQEENVAKLKTDADSKYISFQDNQKRWILTINDQLKPYKEIFKDSLKGLLTGNNLMEELLKSEIIATNYDENELIKFQAQAFDTKAKQLDFIKNVDDIVIPSCDLLDEEIISSGTTPFANNVKNWKNIDWLKAGHDIQTEDCKCPYCQRTLQEDFEENFASCFDEEYQTKIKQLNEFGEKYREFVIEVHNRVINAFNSLNGTKIDITALQLDYSVLETELKANYTFVQNKCKNPSSPINEDYVAITNLDNLYAEIATINEDIKRNNEIVKEKSINRNKCRNEVLQYLKDKIKPSLDLYEVQYKDGMKVCQDAFNLLETEKKKLPELKKLMDEATNKVSSINTVANSINSTLKECGFTGFEVKESKLSNGTYSIIRKGETEPAVGLSEGEKNFIAFLYFYNLVKGSYNKSDLNKDKIVVIDDPVSSMDSDSMFIVISIIRELIDIAKNNVDLEHGDEKQNYIKQIFVLTHNTFFHSSLTTDYEEFFDIVSFFKISKKGNVSKIEGPLTKQNPSKANELINKNPIKNSYKTLWDDLNETTSVSSARNIIRRILEYYFIEICGYKVSDLSKILFSDENKPKFIETDSKGNEITDKLIFARSIIDNVTSTVHHEDAYYSEDDDDNQETIARCKDVLRIIFEAMGQPQHFKYMMR